MPMSQAMWRSRSTSETPRLPRRRGIARHAWSAVRKKSDRPAAPRPPPSSIDLGIAGADRGRREPGDDLLLGRLEAQIDVEEHIAEPLPRGSAGGEIGDRLGQGARQRTDAGGLPLRVGHLPEA